MNEINPRLPYQKEDLSETRQKVVGEDNANIRAAMSRLRMIVPPLPSTDWGITYDEVLELYRWETKALVSTPTSDPAHAYLAEGVNNLSVLGGLLYKPKDAKDAERLCYLWTVVHQPRIGHPNHEFIKEIAKECNALYWDDSNNKCLSDMDVVLQPTDSTDLLALGSLMHGLKERTGLKMRRVPKELVGIEDREMG